MKSRENARLATLRAHWPEIQSRTENYASKRFGRRLNPEALEELTQEAICLAWESCLRLTNRGKAPWLFPASIAFYAVKGAASGRRFGGRVQPNALFGCGPKTDRPRVEPFAFWEHWLDSGPSTDPALLACLRVDWPVFLRTLAPFVRRVVKLFVQGWGTTEVASLTGRSLSRISQIRREVQTAWTSFHGLEVI